MKYKVITEASVREISKIVSLEIEDGWELHGYTTTNLINDSYNKKHTIIYNQAMIKKT